jgi:hypothetical protein
MSRLHSSTYCFNEMGRDRGQNLQTGVAEACWRTKHAKDVSGVAVRIGQEAVASVIFRFLGRVSTVGDLTEEARYAGAHTAIVLHEPPVELVA